MLKPSLYLVRDTFETSSEKIRADLVNYLIIVLYLQGLKYKDYVDMSSSGIYICQQFEQIKILNFDFTYSQLLQQSCQKLRVCLTCR